MADKLKKRDVPYHGKKGAKISSEPSHGGDTACATYPEQSEDMDHHNTSSRLNRSQSKEGDLQISDSKKSKKQLLAEIEDLHQELEEKDKLIETLRTQLAAQANEIDKLRNLWFSAVGSEPTPENNKCVQAGSACYAASKGKISWLQTMLERGADIHQPNPDGRTALHLSVCEDQREVVEFLVKSGAPLHVKDRWGHTPFDEAIRCRHLAIALFLEMAATIQDTKNLEKEYELGAYLPPGAEEMFHPIPLQRKISKFISTVKTPRSSPAPKIDKSLPTSPSNTSAKTKSDDTPKTNIHPAEKHDEENKKESKHKDKKDKKTPSKSHKKTPRGLRNILDHLMKGSSSGGKEPQAGAAANAPTKPPNTPFGLAFGVLRGACKVPDCDCKYYKKGDNNNVCACSHFPASHENLGEADILQGLEHLKLIDEASMSILVPMDSSGGSSWPKILNKELEMDEDTLSLKEALKGEIEKWIIPPQELLFIRQIGQGTSATVYEGIYKEQRVAIKLIQFRRSDKRPRDKLRRQIVEELNVMLAVDHPHVIRFLGAVVEPRICLVIEYCEHGSLYDVLANEDENGLEVDWSLALRWFNETVQGVHYLHTWIPQIVHRDLKTLNLLIDKNLTLKVADFGLSKFLDDSPQQSTLGKLRGTYAYCAPEIYFGQSYSTKSDVYSLGIVLWELATRVVTGKYQCPYSEYPFIQFNFQIIIQAAKKGTRPTISPAIPQPIADLIRLMWAPNPDDRPDTTTLLDMLTKIIAMCHEWDESVVSSSSSTNEIGSLSSSTEAAPKNDKHDDIKLRKSFSGNQLSARASPSICLNISPTGRGRQREKEKQKDRDRERDKKERVKGKGKVRSRSQDGRGQ